MTHNQTWSMLPCKSILEYPEFRLIFFRRKPCGWCIKLWNLPKPSYSAAKTSPHCSNSQAGVSWSHFKFSWDMETGDVENKATRNPKQCEPSHRAKKGNRNSTLLCSATMWPLEWTVETEGKVPGSWLKIQLSRPGYVLLLEISIEEFYILDE